MNVARVLVTLLGLWFPSHRTAPPHRTHHAYTRPAPPTTWPALVTAMSAEPSWVQEAFACIRWHESRTTPTAVNPTSGDSGLYQFANVTWLANGGGQFSSRALYASVSEQNDVAAWTYAADGWQPWTGDNVCWGG